MNFLNKIFIFTIVLSSCSKEIPISNINLKNKELPYEIAVDGFISNECERCRIVLSKPVSTDKEIIKIPIENAQMTLKHENDVFEFEHYNEGEYFTTDSIIACAGESYILEIMYNNNIYIAKTMMPDEPDEVFNLPFYYSPSYDDNEKPRPYDSNFVCLKVYVHNFGYEKTNIWGLEEARFNENFFSNFDTYISFTIPIYTHKGSMLQGLFPSKTGSTGVSGAESDSIEILKAEISEEYNKYLLDKFNETDWQGGMFSTIPGNVSTNLSEGAIGYFYSLNIKRKRFAIRDLVRHE